MRTEFTSCELEKTADGEYWMKFRIEDIGAARRFVLNKENKPYDLIVERHRKKRSLDANGLYWSLVGQLTQATGETPETIYKRHIRDIGNYETLCMVSTAVPDFTRRWVSNHLGRQVETRGSKLPGCTTVLAYYGSSDFDKAQMSRLIDNCIQDCKAVGIDYISPEQASLLLEGWGNAQTN